jgi:hypothetical protein
MSKTEINPNWIMHKAYIRDGKVVHTGEAVTLACLVHSKGKSRKGDDMTEVQRIMGDKNVKRK